MATAGGAGDKGLPSSTTDGEGTVVTGDKQAEAPPCGEASGPGSPRWAQWRRGSALRPEALWRPATSAHQDQGLGLRPTLNLAGLTCVIVQVGHCSRTAGCWCRCPACIRRLSTELSRAAPARHGTLRPLLACACSPAALPAWLLGPPLHPPTMALSQGLPFRGSRSCWLCAHWDISPPPPRLRC